jgi:serine/threonine protein kinase
MNLALTCPDASVFEQLAEGTLSPEDSDVVARHLEQCAACGERFGVWGCDWLRALQGSAGRELPITPPVEAMMRRLEKWSVETPPVGRVETNTTGGGASEEAADPTSMLQPARGGGEIGWLGAYRVLKVLGQGGMGVVFLAEDSVLKRQVALKVMRGALAERPSARQRFLREAQAAAAVRHENVVTIYQAGEQAGVGFLAMELLQGESLDARLARESRLPIAMAVDLGRQIARGLAAAHTRGLIHRDLKPGNIFLMASEQWPVASEKTSAGSVERSPSPSALATGQSPLATPRVKLLDFGLARAAEGESKLTQSGTVVGTPAYMAPEQAEGKPLDARSDLFSLGCVLYQMVTGERPFRGDSTMQVLRALALEQPAAPCDQNPQCPRTLSELILQLLHKNPVDRPASAAAIADRLDRVAGELAAPAVRRRKSRRSWAIAAAVLGLLGLVAAASVAVIPIFNKGSDAAGPPRASAVASSGPTDSPQEKDGRAVWAYTGGWFSTADGKTWIELSYNLYYDNARKPRQFTEVKRTNEYVELYDASLKMSVRLHETKMEWRSDGKDAWSPLLKGQWKKRGEATDQVYPAKAPHKQAGRDQAAQEPATPQKSTGNRAGVRANEQRAVVPTLDLLREAVLLMSFEEDSFYEKDGRKYVRDLSGKGNDGVCENVEFTADGKAGGGLLSRPTGSLRLSKSLINRQANYTITAWVRPLATSFGKSRLYQTGEPTTPEATVFEIEIIQPSLAFLVTANNQHRKPDPRVNCSLADSAPTSGILWPWSCAMARPARARCKCPSTVWAIAGTCKSLMHRTRLSIA